MKRKGYVRTALIVLLMSFSSGSIFAAWTITTIADDQTQMPGHTENFLQFPDAAVIENGQVVFKGVGTGLNVWDQWQGIYSYQNENITIVADENTAMPGEPESRDFVEFGAPSLDNGNILFGATNPYKPANWGLYFKTNSGISKVVDLYTSMPEIGGFFNISYSLDFHDIQNNDLVFTSGTRDYLWTKINGSLELIADQSTVMPGSSLSFNEFITPHFGLKGIVFAGKNNATAYQGLFRYDNGSIETLVDTNTAIPYAPGYTFNAFWGSCPDANSIFFHSQSEQISGGRYFGGIYSLIDGTPEPIIDWRTPMPDRYGYFWNIGGSFSRDGNDIAFSGRHQYPDNYNLYAIVDGHLSLVFESPGMLSYNAFSNGQIVFRVGGYSTPHRLLMRTYTPPGCEGADYVENGFVDGNDLSYFAENWLGNLPYTDIAPETGDGIVNFADFAILAKYWQCPCE